MNNVVLIGRMVRDPEVRYTANQTAVARFTIAIDRMTRQGEEKKTDFPNIVCFGKTAELCERFLTKGRQVGVQVRIQTGSYKTQTGETRYTTEIVADRVEFLGSKNDGGGSGGGSGTGGGRGDDGNDMIPEGFEEIIDPDDPPF